MYNILVCDDEKDIVSALHIYLSAEGYRALTAFDGPEALRLLDREEVHLVLLDVMMPGMDGITAMTRLRQSHNLPVILLTAKSEDTDKVLGLNMGADDYVTKPFNPVELLARVRAAIRHTRTTLSNTQIAQSGKFVTGDLTIDYDKHQVLMNGENAGLTVNEYKIVALLGKYAGKVLTYDFIIRELWGPKAKTDNQILRVNMANIRRKIEPTPGNPQYIFTEVGVGYRMREGD